MLRRGSISSRVFIVIASAVVLYALLSLLVGWRDLGRRFVAYPVAHLPALAGLSLANYVLRFLRWELYRRRCGIVLRLGQSAALFFATFVMVITPGKLGELFKATFLLERHGTPLSRGIPILVAERLFDFLGVLTLAAVGLALWQGPLVGLQVSLAVAALLPLAVVALRSVRLQRFLLRRAAAAPRFSGHLDAVSRAIERFRGLTSPKLSALALLLSLLAWLAECGSLWLVCRGFATPIASADALFIYAAATLAGTLVFLPGGLGGTEATLILLLSGQGLAQDAAVSAALLVRLATLWLAVGLGLLSFWLGRRYLTGGEGPPAQRVLAR
jgi:uncharacterized protein (TIRG00374 family)